jgi:fatty-acyl-CoA synthase
MRSSEPRSSRSILDSTTTNSSTVRHAEVSAAFTAEPYDGMDFLPYFEDVIVELPDLQYLVTVDEEELWFDDRIFRFEDLVSSGEGRRFPELSSAGDASDLPVLYWCCTRRAR